MGSQESKTFKSVQTTFEKGDFIEQVQNKYNLQQKKPTVVQEITEALKGNLSPLTPLSTPLETKITEQKPPADAPKAEEGSSVDPEADEKPKKERVFKKKHVLTRNGKPTLR